MGSKLRFGLALALLLPVASSLSHPAFGQDSVLIVSQDVALGMEEIDVKIRVVNSVLTRLLVVPLEIRPVQDGLMPTTAQLFFSERLLQYNVFIQEPIQYPAKDGVCGESQEAAYKRAISDTTGLIHEIQGNSWGLLFAAIALSPATSLPPGADSIGSMTIRLGLPNATGAFEIDTVCTWPNNHLYFREAAPSTVEKTPSFTPALVTILPCLCTFHGDLDGSGGIEATDLAILIDYVFFGIGAPASDPSCPHVDRGDVNCDGADDVLDIALLIDHINFGGPAPCDPCACDPYPTGCP